MATWVGEAKRTDDPLETPGCLSAAFTCECRREKSPSTFSSSCAVLEMGGFLILLLRMEVEGMQSFFRRLHL